jgi:hypothetical protein
MIYNNERLHNNTIFNNGAFDPTLADKLAFVLGNCRYFDVYREER